MTTSPLLEQLISAFRCLPGVGPKTAQRLAFHILGRDREGGARLSQTLTRALEHIGHCDSCRSFSEHPLCLLCSNQRRDPSILCIVESPTDIMAIEQTGSFHGLYFVLMGHLSPLDAIGPQELGIPLLKERLQQGIVKEIILATNPTVEGDATAHYLAQLCRPATEKITRIAYGVPLGGELEWVNADTLARAMSHREEWV
jgi:recombination protein RecR